MLHCVVVAAAVGIFHGYLKGSSEKDEEDDDNEEEACVLHHHTFHEILDEEVVEVVDEA